MPSSTAHPTILVTGGAGFIGSHIVEHFQGRAAEIRVLDNLRTGKRGNLAGLDHEFIEGSITDTTNLREALEGVDLVFHLAAFVSVAESMEQAALCDEINTEGTLRLLEEACDAGVRKLLLTSSAAIYGDGPITPTPESAPPSPKSPYATSKLEGERHGERFQREGRIEFAALRCFNVFGPRQDPASAYAAAVPVFMDRALRGEPLVIYGDGQQTRDFIYVKDVAAANAHIAEKGRTSLTGVFNVGQGSRTSILELCESIKSRAGSSSKIVFKEARPGDVLHSQADTGRLQASGFQPRFTIDDALEETFQWYQQAERQS